VLSSPCYATPETTAQELRQTVNRIPCAYGQSGTRWILATLLLERLRITWQHARSYIHSPDLDYDAKLANVQTVRMLVEQAPGQVVVVNLDEVTIATLSQPGIGLCAAGLRPVPAARTLEPQQQYPMMSGSSTQDSIEVDGVRQVSLITIVDVPGHLKVESYPCLDTTNPPLEACQGKDVWNQWRPANSAVRPDFNESDIFTSQPT